MQRYYNMTMTELLNLKARKLKEIHRLLRSGMKADKDKAAKLEEHIVYINAEIAGRVEQLPLFLGQE